MGTRFRLGQRPRPAVDPGEFGTYQRADQHARAHWTRTVRAEAERLGIPWCYWDLNTDFGLFDPATQTWHGSLLAALVTD
jgi:endoglucanase